MTDGTQDQFALNLKGNGINIERDVDQKTAAAIVALIMGGSTTPSVVPIAISDSETDIGASSQKSLNEFLMEVLPTTNVERIVAIGVYLHKFKSNETFSKEEIEAGFRKAREPLPSNLGRDLVSSVRAGVIGESEEKGYYYVTNTGEHSLEANQNKGSSSRRTKSKKAAKKPAAQSSDGQVIQDNKKKKKNSVGELRPLLDQWVESGFFNEPRTIRTIMERYHERAIIVPQTSLSGLLLRAVREGLLSRTKIENNGKSVWGYSRGDQ